MKLFRILKSIILLFLSLQISIFPQSDFDLGVAKAGNLKITSDEFLQRYEFTPFAGKHIKRTQINNKLNFLYTIIAEKLWAIEAENLGLDTTEVIRFSTEQFEKMFVRDALFHQEIKNKVSVTEEEIGDGYLKYLSHLEVNFLFAEDESEINNLYNLLKNGIHFDSLLIERYEYAEQEEPVKVIYGQMDEKVEDSLYNLRIVNFTSPILTPDGWYIFYLKNRIKSLINTEADKQNAFKEVKKIIEDRKITKYFDEYYKDFFKNKKIETDGDLYKILVLEFKKIFKEKYELKGVEEDNLLTLEADDVLKVEERIGQEKLSNNYIHLDFQPFTLKYYIRLLAFDGFKIKPEEIEYLPQIIYSKNRSIIEKELLAREGISKGYNMLPELQNDIRMWKENYLFQVLRNQFLDSVSVSEDEAFIYYKTIKKEEKFPPLINIIEVLNDNAEVIEHVLEEIKKGKDIRELALHFSTRDFIKEKNGETGLVSIHQLGEIGNIAYGMEVGEIFGPIKLKDGFSIFKLIDKKEERIEKPRSFESMKNNLIRELSFKKMKKILNDFTVKLAVKYGVEVNEDLLNSIDVTNINSFGFRFLGFGNKITAVPLLEPNYNWIDDYYKSIDINQ